MGINQRLALPDIGPEDEVRETILTKEEAGRILDYCERFEYATLRHALFYLLWHTEMRSSSAHAWTSTTTILGKDGSMCDTVQRRRRR
jgi:integrase